MTFLPIVERELRVAARKQSTFWLRVAAAVIGLVIAGAFLITAMVGAFPFPPSSFGKGLFSVLTWLSFAIALSAGLFFTSDCLSEEKREGTLGFLFLTDLRGYDVVFGKLLATSLRAICALLAVFPILALTLLMGGVTGAQFWTTALALVNALFISLATGMFVSAISHDSQKALSATLLLLVLLVGVGPAVDAITGLGGGFQPVLSLSSPGYLFIAAGSSVQAPVLQGLMVNQAIGWALIGLTCALLPRAWQERGRPETKLIPTSKAWDWNRSQGRQQQRLKLLTPNPILWLASRHRWQRMPVWIVAILLISSAAIFTALGVPWVLWLRSYLAGALTLVLYLSVASQAGRFFVEARRNGLLELLLATPLTAGQIVQGQWRALLRLFATPLVICFLAQWLGAYAVQQAALGTFRRTPAVVTGTNATTTNAPVITSTIRSGTATTTVSFTIIAPAATGLGTGITFLANLCALSWFGMWMGLTSKNTNAATLKTITFVQIIPWFVITFASGMIIPLMVLPRVISRAPSLSSQSMLWYSLLTSGVGMLLALGKDAGFFFLARQKLYSEFREMATCTLEPIRLQFAPPPSLPDAPPIIGQG